LLNIQLAKVRQLDINVHIDDGSWMFEFLAELCQLRWLDQTAGPRAVVFLQNYGGEKH
jgi:hypothetical protein